MRDLGLSYEAAGHGIQSAIRFEMTREGLPDDSQDKVVRMLKHMRVGIDSRAADAGGLASLLINKGVFTQEEYLEQMRLSINEELARYTDHIRQTYNLPGNISFA